MLSERSNAGNLISDWIQVNVSFKSEEIDVCCDLWSQIKAIVYDTGTVSCLGLFGAYWCIRCAGLMIISPYLCADYACACADIHRHIIHRIYI